MFGLSSIKDIDRTFKYFCDKNAEKNSAMKDKNFLKYLRTLGNTRSTKQVFGDSWANSGGQEKGKSQGVYGSGDKDLTDEQEREMMV